MYLNCKVVDVLMGSFTVFNSINMCIGTHFLFFPLIGWLGASLRIVQHRLLINWQRYLSKCFFMKECRGDRKHWNLSEETTVRKGERDSAPHQILTCRCKSVTQMYISQVFITQVYILHVYITQVSITHPLKNKKWTGRSLDHRSAYNTSFLLKGT